MQVQRTVFVFTVATKIVFKISNMERRVRLSSTTVVSVTLRDGQVDLKKKKNNNFDTII